MAASMLGRSSPSGAGEHEREIGLLGGEEAERLDQARQVLAPLERADGEHVRPAVELGRSARRPGREHGRAARAG